MKTAKLKALSIELALREAVQNVLSEEETFSNFAEDALNATLERRLHQQGHIASGMASREQAIQKQTFYSAENVLSELCEMLNKASA